jgi:release factor glutamine methyltransferase
MTMTNLQSWLEKSVILLEKSETPNLEAQVLASFCLGKTREWIISHSEFEIPETQFNEMNLSLNRLVKGEPLPYITGKQAFYGLDFLVSPAVLIPRPETELLVEEAIAWLESHPIRRKAIDICTGSGIIAITLADTFPEIKITATDLSNDALDIARRNSHEHQVDDKITFIKSDVLEGIKGKFDLIVSNPPYIPTAKLAELPVIQYEPRLALDGGEDGLTITRKIFKESREKLLPGGAIFIEIESTLGKATMELARNCFIDAEIDLICDYADLPRLVRIQT